MVATSLLVEALLVLGTFDVARLLVCFAVCFWEAIPRTRFRILELEPRYTFGLMCKSLGFVLA